MEYAVVAVGAAPVRKKASHPSEMVSQLLFGETVEVLKQKDELWVKIRSLHDEYEGWMTTTLLKQTDKDSAFSKSLYCCTGLLQSIEIGDQKIHIPFGSGLPLFENGTGKIGDLQYSYRSAYSNRFQQEPNPGLIEQLTSLWLNAPYLWGGRTPLGVDCSGFVQVIFKVMGIDLTRDAWQQAEQGKKIKKLSDCQPGDLAFFNSKEDIVHVGIILGGDRIIHASGKVRIDKITKKGLVNMDTGKRTLNLAVLRRVIPTP